MDGIVSSGAGNPAVHGVLVSAGPGTYGNHAIVPGTAGTVLTSAGPGADPIWTTITSPSSLPEAPNDTHIYGRGQLAWQPLDSFFYSVNGGTIFGSVAIHAPSPAFIMIPTGPTQPALLLGTNESQVARWAVLLDDGSTESGGNIGSNFGIQRYTDAGALIDKPFTINRQNGVATFNMHVLDTSVAQINNAQQLTTKAYVDSAIASGVPGGPFVPISGGTMTGDLTISKNQAFVRLNALDTGAGYAIFQNGTARWNVGTVGPNLDLTIVRFDNSGAGIDQPLTLSRTTGQLSLAKVPLLPGDPVNPLEAATKQYVDAHAGGGGNVSNSGSPVNGQIAQWVDATHIAGIAPTALGLQPFDQDLTSIANYGGTGTWLFRSAANTWSPVTIGANLTFVGGTLAATAGGGGGGDVFQGGNNNFIGTNTFTGSPTVIGSATSPSPAGSSLQVVNVEDQHYQFSADSLGSQIRLRKSRSPTVGTQTVVQDQDALGSISFEGTDGTNYLGGTGLFAFVDGAPSTGSINSALVLTSRQAGASGGTARVWVSPKGHISHNMRWNNDPSNALDSVASFANPDSAQSGTRISIFDFGGGATPAASVGIWFRKNRAGGNPAAFGATLDNDGAQISSAGCDGTGYVNHSAIGMLQDGAVVGAGQIPGKIVFNTRDIAGGNIARMSIYKNGTVQVGGTLTQPLSGGGILQVIGGSVTVDSLTGGTAQVSVTNYQNAAGSAFLTLRHTRGGAIGTIGLVQQNDPLGSIQFWGTNATVFTSQINASITCQVENVVGAADTSIDTRLMFFTSKGAPLAEKMRLTGQGCLVIGQANIGLDIGPGIIAPSGLYGTQTNDNALTGCVGEYVQVLGNAGAPITLTSGGVNLCQFALPAGDWDVWGGTVVNQLSAVGFITSSISTISGTIDGTVGNYAQFAAGNISNAVIPMAVQRRISAPGTGQTVYLAANCSNGAPTAYGWMMARRRR